MSAADIERIAHAFKAVREDIFQARMERTISAQEEDHELVRAVLRAIREPEEGQLDRARRDADRDPFLPAETWKSMIDHLLEE